MLFQILFILSCGKDENSDPTASLFFDCFDSDSFGVLRPHEYFGLPTTCFNTVLDESYNEAGNWYKRNDNEYKFSVHNGHYDLESLVNNNFYINLGDIVEKKDDYQIEAYIEILSSETESNSGLSWGGQNGIDGGLFYLGFTSQGSFKIGKVKDNSAQADVLSLTVNQAVLSNNKITIRFWQGAVYAFINEQLVYQNEDYLPYGNEIGIKVGFKSHLLIDWFLVQTIDL